MADTDAQADYGLWPLVIVNTALFAVFAASFFHPRTGRDWRAMGAFTAFLVALFTEMYGVPLTVYLLSGWLGSTIPGLPATHAGGHLWNDLIGWGGDPHLSPFHLASYAFIGGGVCLIAAAWRVLHDSARAGALATTGPYARVRHPQYDGFLLIVFGFLLQWPTIPTLVMFPTAGRGVRIRALRAARMLPVRRRWGAGMVGVDGSLRTTKAGPGRVGGDAWRWRSRGGICARPGRPVEGETQ